MANPPPLRLIVVKGPRSGDTLECKPTATTRIGRVVKGNTFPIKEPGISQKHLILQFLPETSRWAVTDLDTSNGTLLNGASIVPSVPIPLSDGDNIKIGETTSINIEIRTAEKPPLPPVPVSEDGQRPRRRRGKPAAVAEPDLVEVSVQEPVKKVGRGRPRKKSVARSDAFVEVSSEKPVNFANKGKNLDSVVKEAAEAIDPAKSLEKDDVLEEVCEEIPELVKAAGRGRGWGRGKGRGRGSGPMTRAARRGASMVEERSDSVPAAAQEGLEAPEPEGESLISVSVDDVEALKVPGPDGENLQAQSSGSDRAKLVSEAQAGKGAEKVNNDWENMTLGQWFDRMEVVLPQMINDTADEIIADMRDKARRFDQYVAECSSNKMFKRVRMELA